MEEKELKELLLEGKTNQEIADMYSVSKGTISYYIKKYNLREFQKYKKNENFKFEKINTPEKAYTLGFILADSNISIKDDIEISVAARDKEVLDFISEVIKGNIFYDNVFDKKTRRFPRYRLRKRIKDITKFTGGRIKKERHYPRVRKDLEKYLLLGFFDGDGCITFGRRKDRNRVRHKVSFTSQLKLLEGVQQVLLKELNISTVIRPKSNENCYILEFANKNNVLKFLDYIYSDNDFIILKRKHLKYNALRLELEEFGESIEEQCNAEPSL